MPGCVDVATGFFLVPSPMQWTVVEGYLVASAVQTHSIMESFAPMYEGDVSHFVVERLVATMQSLIEPKLLREMILMLIMMIMMMMAAITDGIHYFLGVPNIFT